MLSAISLASAVRGVQQLRRGWMLRTSPPASASSAEKTRPVATHSIAWPMPTIRGRNQLEQASGTMPRRVNTNPRRASSAASRMSIGRVIVTPTPTAGPLIAAISGFLRLEQPQRQLAAAVAGHLGARLALAPVERLAPAGEIGACTEAPARRRSRRRRGRRRPRRKRRSPRSAPASSSA